MKRLLCTLLAVMLCGMVFFPVGAYATAFSVYGTDMTIDVDDSQWYVFTRDNIKDNPELEELSISEEYMEEVFRENDAYMDAILFFEDGDFLELFIKKKSVDTGLANMSNYDDDEILEMAKELAEENGIKTYDLFKSKYKFIRLESYDRTYGYYLCEFFTVVNKDGYTLTFQTTAPFTDEGYEEIEAMIRSIRFDVDESLKEKKPLTVNILRTTAVGAVVGGAVGGVMALINKKKKKAGNTDEVTPV